MAIALSDSVVTTIVVLQQPQLWYYRDFQNKKLAHNRKRSSWQKKKLGQHSNEWYIVVIGPLQKRKRRKENQVGQVTANSAKLITQSK